MDYSDSTEQSVFLSKEDPLLKYSSKRESKWVASFVSRRENKGLLHLPDTFIGDKFNYAGCENLLNEPLRTFDCINSIKPSNNFTSESTMYLILHQRYILSREGMADMYSVISKGFYGTCSRVGCGSTPYIPIGSTSKPGIQNMQVYCHNCKNLYIPNKDFTVDGCAFGKTFPHLFEMSYRKILHKVEYDEYIPTIYGIRIDKKK